MQLQGKMKKIYIINGAAGSGKDQFVKYISKHISTKHISIVDPLKEAATHLGYNNEKTDAYRRFIYDLKELTDNHNKCCYNYVKSAVREFENDNKSEILFIDVRDCDEVFELCNEFNAESVLITRKGVTPNTSNPADEYVYEMLPQYDYRIENNGTLEDLEEIAKTFLKTYIKGSDKNKYKNAIKTKSDTLVQSYSFPNGTIRVDGTLIDDMQNFIFDLF